MRNKHIEKVDATFLHGSFTYQLPVIEAGLKYKNPAHYDDELNIEATIKKLFTAKVHIEYKITRKEDNTLIATGFTEHMFMKEDTKRPTKPPQIYIDALKQYFQ